MFPMLMFRQIVETPPEPGGLWTPNDLDNCVLWLDPSDSSTVTVEAGLVAEITDKMGNYNFNNTDSATRPVLLPNGVNGLDVIDFGASLKFISSNSARSLFRNSGYGGLFFVTQSTGGSNSQNILWYSSSTSAFASMVRVFNQNSRLNLAGRRLPGGAFQSLNVGLFTANETQIFGGEYKWQAARLDGWINGSLINSLVPYQQSGNLEDANSIDNPRIGSNTNNTDSFTGKLCEMLVVKDVPPTQDDIDRIFGYFAHKWGATSYLPTDHPYKTEPPTTGVIVAVNLLSEDDEPLLTEDNNNITI